VAVAKLKITKSGQSGVLVMGMGKDHTWYMDQTVGWFPAKAGTWTRVANATKFRQWTYIVLLDGSGTEIVAIGEPPYSVGTKFTAHLIEHWLFFHTDGEEFEVDPIVVPPAAKAFKIRENWDLAVSYLVFQGETAGMEIQDPATGANAFYFFKGSGLSLPIPKLPKLGGGPTTPGPWNDFTAPGWMGVGDFEGDATMQTIYSLGLGTSQSANVFDFAGSVDGRRGYLVHLASFSTGSTFSLPSSGVSHGSMTLTTSSSAPQPPPRRLGGCGKFGCNWSK
jgi:hypothetical protein